MPTSTCEEFDVVIVGAGPVGLLAALACTSRNRVLLAAADEPHFGSLSSANSSRIESIPVGVLYLLLEYGVSPDRLGITHAFRESILALNTQQPVLAAKPKTVHVPRPGLECALWEQVRRDKRITLALGAQEFSIDGQSGATGADWHASRVIDASGRSAVTADHVRTPPHPWVARSFNFAFSFPDMRFRMAVLTDGYVYRLGMPDCQTVVLVGRDRAVRGDPDELEDMLAEHRAGWVMDGLPPLRAGEAGACPASLQIASSAASTMIGDAALARDILSSQGLSCGLSDAIYASAISDEADRALFEQRKRKQCYLHLKEMTGLLESHAHSGKPVWAGYRDFLRAELATHSGGQHSSSDVVLRDLKLQLRPVTRTQNQVAPPP